MKTVKPRKIIFYKAPTGEEPFPLWFDEIKDKRLKDAVAKRLERVEKGALGECKSVGGGVRELKFRASGVRIYFAEVSGYIVLLLCSGNKASQVEDIKNAKQYWNEFGSRVEHNKSDETN